VTEIFNCFRPKADVTDMADVLVVDDDPDIRTILAFLLVDEKHHVRVAADGEAGLRAMQASAPECLIVDMMMPKLDGLGLLEARRLQGLAPRMRVIILTCKTGERDYVRGWELGADEYITKPFDGDDIVKRVAQLLATPHADLAAHRQAELNKAELLDRLEATFRP
jgi:DNA-binding response OmpR family regulator